MNSRVVIGWRELVAVMLGGMLGTGIRFGIDGLLPHGDDDFPLGTLLINVVGLAVTALAYWVVVG